MKYVFAMLAGGTMVAGSFLAGIIAGYGIYINGKNREKEE